MDENHFIGGNMLLSKNHSGTWDELLLGKTSELQEIEKSLGENFTPSIENILRFLNSDLCKIKVCIVGQDPYYSLDNNKLVANGRSFQPNNLEKWSQPYRQVSLKNIIRLVHKTYKGIDKYEDILSYKNIVNEISNGSFGIKQPKEWFDSLETQGVLFLNRYLTTDIGQPNAHRNIWDGFMKDVFKFIDEKRPDLIWFLWGNEAQQSLELIDNGVIYKSRHPMMCSKKYEDDFLKSECFKDTMNVIDWLG